jgi:hypothetical protein
MAEMLPAPDPFDTFETAAEIFAFVHRKLGEKGLRQLLAMGDGSTCEFLHRAADELSAMGLRKVADIVLDVAADSPSEADPCPYVEGSHNAQGWYYSLRRRQRQRSSA